jgi:hypothetical protein
LPYILETGCIPRLAQFMMHNNIEIAVPSLRSIGNLIAGDDFLTQMAINSDILLKLNELILSKNIDIRKDVYWIFSNITAGSA